MLTLRVNYRFRRLEARSLRNTERTSDNCRKAGREAGLFAGMSSAKRGRYPGRLPQVPAALRHPGD